ncbi:stAR-related lipid transfer protein 9 isoform X2 [Chiloscyllium punctatum]|uniref:stAR-related lipid transfer protein 9 isoform X2 n=1 Tax=Chiloscyllium punctatum TaxID=137246 RepID=UPI003B636F0A
MANVQVAVRVRPLSKRENAEGSSIIVQVDDKVASIRNIKLDSRLDSPGNARERKIEFTFDYCYWSVDPDSANFAPQELVYQDLGTSVLSGAIEGYNVCLFAYGQTGSGKTYTMMGTPASVGLTPRICKGLFSRVDDYQEKPTSCRIEVSFLEIYNERVRDLLKRCDGNKPYTLRVREHPDKGPYVQGLSQHLVSDYKQLIELLEEGNSNRITAATHIHDASSRSHAIFTIHYTQAILESHLPSEIVSKINLVDLAGSERADPNFCKDRITEGSNINKSLVTLGIVISTLAQNSQMSTSCQSINSMVSEGDSGSHSSAYSGSSRRQCYVPYRDSVLTWLLKDSLGGNSKTIMIATISPASTSYSETISTLRYAAHAKNIINKPRVNEDANVKLIRELREEIDRLKAMLMSFELRNSSPSLSDEKDGSLTEMLLQNELKIDQLAKDWKDRWKDTKAIMEEYYVDINRGKAGVIVASQLPHLIAVDEDILSTGVALYHLREGTTTIGRIDAETEQDIVLQGPWVESEHCVIHNHNGIVTIEPIGGSQCSVNELDITHSCRLSQGAVIVIGKVHKFRFNHPTEAAMLRQRRTSSSMSLESSGSCEWLDLDGEFNFSPPYVLSPLMQASFEHDKEKDEEMELSETRRQLVELRERYQNKQQEHKEYKHKLKALEAFYQGQVQQQECYIEELRKHIQAAQSQAEQELKHDQEQLKQQIELNQQCLANEERRLESLAQHRRELGTQTEIVTFTECGVQITLQNKEIPSLEQDRKRLVQLELLQKHSLKKAERNISKKRVKYQLERIAGKQKLLEAKTNLQHLEAASLLSKDQLKQPTMDKMNTLQTSPNPKLTKWNKSFPPYSLPATKQSPSVRLLARRHSDSNDLVSRLYPQYVPVYSDFLKRKNLATSPQTKKWHSSTQESHSVGSSPKQGLSNSRQQAFKRGSETVSPAWGQNHKKQKAVGYENVSKPEAITEPNESRNFTDKEHTQKDNMNDLHPEVQQVSSKVPENKHSSGCMLSETRILVPDLVDVETNRDKLLKVTNEDMRQDFSWKRMFMDVGDTSRVCKKPPCGRLSRAKRVCKECAMRTSSLSQCQHPIKGASSLVNLWEQVPHPDQTSKWHSDKILNAGITTAARDSLRDWSGTEETSDGESVYSVDSLSSAYATALKEQLLDEELEAHQGEWHDDCSGSDDSQMSQDSLVDTDTKLAAGMMNVSVLYNKVTGFNLANRGRSISLNSLADVKGQSDIFGMDSAESTASDEMPAEMYWNLPWTEGDETKAHQASEAQLDKNQGMGAVRLKRLNFYLSSNTELKTTGTDKNTRLENLEPNRNDMDSVIVTDGWSSCESSRRSNLKADSACDTCVSGISQEQDERIWIRPVLNFGPPHDCQQYDGTCNFPFVNLREDNAPCTEDKDNSLDQEKAHLISTFRTDRVTTSDPSCTEHPKVNVTEMVGNPKIETLHALARKTQDSNVPDQVFTTQQYPLLIQSKELGESFVTDSCLKLRSAGTDVVASRQNVSSEMEVANREQQITETEAMRTQSQGNLFDDETCHRRCDMRGSASKVNTTNFSSGFESLVISGTEQSTLQSESQTLSDFSCPPTISNSSGPYGLVCGPLEQVLDPSVEFGYIQKNGQVDTSLLTDSIILGNSLMQNETKPSLEFSAIQHKDSDSVLSALMKDGHSQTEQSNLNLERVRQTAKSFIMQGSLDTKCTVTKGKDSCDLLASSVRNIAVQKPKNHRDLLRNDGGYTSTEALLQAAANPEDSEGKINELRTTDDEPFISLQQSVVSNVVSNKKEEFLLRNKGHDKEATKISCNPDVEDCLHYPGNPCNGDSQDQQCANILSEETTELTSPTCGQSVPNFNTEEPQTNVGSRLCDRFNLDCNILTKLNSAYCTLPKKHNIPAESLSRDHLHQPFIQEPENINMLIKEESETSHGPNTERVSIKESMTYQLESTNTQRNRSRSKAEVNQSVHDHQKTDVNQNDVATDLQTVQFIKESNVREKRFRSDYVSATNFLDYEEIGIDNVSEAKLNKDNMVNGAVQSNLCYFGVSPPSDLIEDSVMMTDAGFLGEPRDCEVPVEKQVYSVGTSIDVQTTACEGGEVLFGDADDGQTRVICTEPIQRGGVASDCREQDNSKGNSPVNGAAEKFGSNPGTTDHYFQKTSLITRRSNVAKINGSARTTSVDLVNDSKACELFTLHKNRGECTAKIGKEGNKVLFFCSEDLEQLNENDSDEVRASQKATEIKEDRPSGRFNSLKYSSEQTCVTQCVTENEDVLGQTSKERSQLCDWSYRVTEACNSMARSSLAFHSEINASYDAGHTRKAVGPSQQENAVAAQNIGIESKSYLETEYNIKTSSNEIESKYDCELQLKTDLLMYPAKGNEMLTDNVQDVSRIILESNEEGDAMDLIQEKDVVVEFEDRANGGNAADISYGAVTLDNQLPFTVVDCTLGKCENNEPSSMPKPETAERMPKNSEPVKSLTESKISMETKNIAEQNGSALFIHNDNQETKLSACQLVDRSIPYLRTDNSSQQNCLHPLSPPTFANNDDPMGTNSKESATRNEQHIMCEENVLSFSRNKTEHLVSTKTSLVTNRTCSSNDQSFRFATCMAHGTEIRQTLPDRYSQDIPQDVVITSATGEVDCEIKEQDSADIFRSIKSAASCMNSFNEEEQSLSQEKALPVIENSDCKTLQEIDLFAMVSEGSEVCSAASLWDIDGHSFTNQQLQTTPECVQAELGNHAPVDFKALPVPPENNFVVDSVELSLTSSKAGSTADENLHLRRLDCELFCKHITQQQLAKSIAMTDRATCSKATPLRQNSGQGKLYEEPISTPKPIETIPETDTPQPRGISLVQQDISEVVESTQSCFISKDNLKEISGENTGASECQTDSTFSRKDECSGAGTILPSQGIVLKEVIGKHVMWYQLDTPAISNVSDFQIDEQADHSDQARFVLHHLVKVGAEAVTHRKQETCESVVYSGLIVPSSGIVDAKDSFQKQDAFKVHQFLHNPNTRSPALSGLHVENQSEAVKISRLESRESQVGCGKLEVSLKGSLENQHGEANARGCTSFISPLVKPEEKEVSNEQRLCLHKQKPIEIQTQASDGNPIMPPTTGLNSLESALDSSELLTKPPASEMDQNYSHSKGLQHSIQEQSLSTPSLTDPSLLATGIKCQDANFSNTDQLHTFTPLSFTESFRHQKPITLDCRRQGEDSSVSLTDGDLTSELTEDSLNLLVAISEQPSKLVEKSAASYGKTAETAGCPQNGNDKNIPDSANKKSVQKEVNGSERYEEAQLQLQGVQSASKQEQLCSGGANKNHEVSAHVKDEKKSHSPTKVDFIPQHAPECSNKPSVQTRTQKVVEPATSECKSEMHHSHSHTNFCTSVYQKKQLTELQQTPNQFTPEHKLSFEAKLQTKDLNGAGVTPDVTETYNKHFFQESVDLSVIQIEQSEGSVRCKQIGKLGPQSRTSNKCTEMNQICHATDLLTLSDSPRSNCSVHSSVTEVSDGSGERFNTTTTNVLKKKSQRMRSKPIIDVTKDSSSSDEEVDIEFLSLKELRSRRCQRDNSKSQSCICKGKGSVNTIGAKLEEMRSPLLKQKQAAPVVHISSSNMDPPVQDSSGYSPTAALITNSFDAFNSSDAAVSTYREQVVEAGTGKDMHENLCQKLNLRSDLVGERVSLNPDSNMSAIVHSEVVSPCKQGIKQQSNKHQISATSYESHPGMFTEGKLKEQHLPEEMSFCKGKDLMHFASSDINPYVHQWQCNELHRANWKQCVFGSTSNVRNVQSQLSSPDRVMRCSSVDNGLNVQNSPFSSHLSCYVNERAISDTLSNVSDFQDETSEAASSDPSDLETFQRLSDQSIPASFFCSSQFPCPNREIEDARSQVDEIVLLYPTESSVKSASDGSLEFTCNQATQTPGGVTQQRSIQQRKCTQTLTQTPKPQNPWSNLENLSAHLSQFLHSTTELLGNIRPNTNYLNEIISPSNQMPGASGTAKTADCCTQTAMDVAIQTETLSLSPEEDGLENARKEVLSSPEVNVIVRVIGSDVNMSQEHANVTLTLQEQQQSSGVSDLNTRHRQSQCSSLSTEGGKSSVRTSTPVSLDTQKLVSNSSQVCSISPGDSPVATASQESVLSDFTQCIKSVSSLESTSEFPKLETYSPSVLEDRQKKSFSQGFQARQEAAFADIKPADLVDRASSPIQTLEAGSASWRSCSKSFQCPEGGLWHSDYWKRKPRSASWYGLNEKQQHEINFRQMESESEQRVETNSVSLVLFHEQNKFASNDLSSSTQWESTADSNDGVQSSSLSSSPSSESARACNAGPSRQWEKNAMTVGHSEQVPLCNSAQSKESESQLVLHSVQMLSTSNTEVRKLENSSAFSPAYHNPALSSCTPTLSKSDDTTILSRRIFHRSSSMPSVQQIPFSENGIDLQERESRTLQDQSPSQNDSINDCNSVSGTSIMSEKTIEFTTEDAQSLVSSECNTEMLLNENLSTSDCNGLPVSSSRTAGCRGPEDLPLHNKFCNWSGVHYRPLSTSSGISEVTRSRRQTKQKQTKGRMTEVADFQSELQDVRQKEIESLRQERAEIMSGMYLDFNQHQLTVELTEAKLNYGLGETDALLRVLQCGSADDINVSIRQKLYDRHMKTIKALRKERNERLQKFRRTRSLSPQKYLTSRRQKCPTTSHADQDHPSAHRDYLQRKRQELVESTQTQAAVKGREESTSEIEHLLRDYQKAREEAKMEIAKATDKLRARTEMEKCRLQQQMITQILKEKGRVKNVVSRSSLCSGSSLSLFSNPTSGYSSSNTACPDNSQTKNKSGIDDLITSRGRTAYRRSHVNVTDHPTDVTIESIHASCSPVESVSGNISHHISHTASSNYFKKYQDLATHTVASVKAEVMVASINNLSNLLHGKSAAGWRYHCTEKGVQIFYKKYASPTKHGFLGVGVIEKPLHCVWCTVKDHSKRQLYDSSVKTVKIHQQLGNGIELVYLVNDTSVCYLSQPRDFCCISVEAKEDQQYILAMQSIYEESMPRPVKDLVRGEMMPSGWILQPDTQNGKEVTRLIYLTQVDLGAPALPARLLGSVAKRQPLCIANLASLFSC